MKLLRLNEYDLTKLVRKIIIENSNQTIGEYMFDVINKKEEIKVLTDIYEYDRNLRKTIGININPKYSPLDSLYYRTKMNDNGELYQFTLVVSIKTNRLNVSSNLFSDLEIEFRLNRDKKNQITIYSLAMDTYQKKLGDKLNYDIEKSFFQSKEDLNKVIEIVKNVGNNFMGFNLTNDDIINQINEQTPNLIPIDVNSESEEYTKQSSKELFFKLLDKVLLTKDEEEIFSKLLNVLQNEKIEESIKRYLRKL